MRAGSIEVVLIPLAWTLVAALVPDRPAQAGQRAAPSTVLPVRVWEAGERLAVDRVAVRQATLALLDASQVRIAWRDCGPAHACEQEPPRIGVTVILSAAPRPDCGVTALEPDLASATVIVSVPCVADVVGRVRRSGNNQGDPRLASLRTEHLLGAAIAHELGHAMGLSHADRGLMRARLGVEEIVALRDGLLAFTPLEATRMRASRLWADALVAADR